MLTVDRLELVRDLLIKLVIIRRALSKQRNINLVVLRKITVFQGRLLFWSENIRLLSRSSCAFSVIVTLIAFSNADQLYRFQEMTYEKDSSY